MCCFSFVRRRRRRFTWDGVSGCERCPWIVFSVWSVCGRGSHLAFETQRQKCTQAFDVCGRRYMPKMRALFEAIFLAIESNKHGFCLCNFESCFFFFSVCVPCLVAFHFGASVSKCQRDKFMGAELWLTARQESLVRSDSDLSGCCAVLFAFWQSTYCTVVQLPTI